MAKEAPYGGAAVGRLGRRAPKPRSVRAPAATCWDATPALPVEITAPDPESARALLRDAVTRFRAELVETAGTSPVVRLRPAAAATDGWVFELLAMVERWLDAHGFQCVNVHHGSRSYVITAPPSGEPFGREPAPASAA